MTIIEGVGDEVIHFFILLLVIFIALVAWWSTNISERPLIRTVLILERRTTRRTPTDTQTTPVDTTDASEITQETSEAETEPKSAPSDPEENSQIEVNVVERCDNVLVNDEDLQNTISNLGKFISECKVIIFVVSKCSSICSQDFKLIGKRAIIHLKRFFKFKIHIPFQKNNSYFTFMASSLVVV